MGNFPTNFLKTILFVQVIIFKLHRVKRLSKFLKCFYTIINFSLNYCPFYLSFYTFCNKKYSEMFSMFVVLTPRSTITFWCKVRGLQNHNILLIVLMMMNRLDRIGLGFFLTGRNFAVFLEVILVLEYIPNYQY